MPHEDIRRRGFKDRTPLPDARERLQETVSSHDRTETVPLIDASDRVTADAVTAARNVPHYDRAAMDGYAVQAADTFGASTQAPNRLEVTETIAEGTAVRVHTGSALPAKADAVVMIEAVERDGDRLDVFEAVAEGENVGKTGEDVREGTRLYEAGQRLRPSDIGLLKSVGLDTASVMERPRVAVVPTGDELVQADPNSGEIIETNGLTVAQSVRRWGGNPTYRSIVRDEREALKDAIRADLDHDLVVTTGGSSVGERDLVPELVADMGTVFVHGVALKPGHPVALGAIDGTPVLMLPGYPVACLVNAVQFLRPAISWSMGADPPHIPTDQASLERKLRSEPGHRTFARVAVTRSDDEVIASPVRASGSGVLSSVTNADGWVEVPEAREGYAAGETVTVQYWEWSR